MVQIWLSKKQPHVTRLLWVERHLERHIKQTRGIQDGLPNCLPPHAALEQWVCGAHRGEAEPWCTSQLRRSSYYEPAEAGSRTSEAPPFPSLCPWLCPTSKATWWVVVQMTDGISPVLWGKAAPLILTEFHKRSTGREFQQSTYFHLIYFSDRKVSLDFYFLFFFFFHFTNIDARPVTGERESNFFFVRYELISLFHEV